MYLLQSRPITTLTSWTDFELTHEQDTPCVTENSLYTIANTGEVRFYIWAFLLLTEDSKKLYKTINKLFRKVFPTALSALCRSASLPFIDRGVQLNLSPDVEPYYLRTTPVFSNRAFLDCINVSSDLNPNCLVLKNYCRFFIARPGPKIFKFQPKSWI